MFYLFENLENYSKYCQLKFDGERKAQFISKNEMAFKSFTM